MNLHENTDWPGWIVALVTIGGIMWATGRRLFSSVTRDELKGIMAAYEKRFETYEKRFVTLETDRITRSDMDSLRKDMNEGFNKNFSELRESIMASVDIRHDENKRGISAVRDDIREVRTLVTQVMSQLR